MTFRLEEKIFINDLNLFEFKKWLSLNNGKLLFPSRLINSIYFDNNLKMYSESIEGIIPRKKIRIRTYGTKNFFSSKKIKKEIKTSYYNHRKKIVEDVELNQKLFMYGIADKNYGNCAPVLNVFYNRSYYIINNFRLTLDENINYRPVKNSQISKLGVKDKQSIIEIKSNNIFDKDNLLRLFPLQRSRFSKYCRGIELLGLV